MDCITSVEWKQLPFNSPSYNEDRDTLVRQSTIGQCQLCEYRHALSTEEGYLEPVSEALVFGTCQHHLISEDLKAGELRLDLLATMHEWVEQILVEEYDWTLSKIPNVRDFFSELASAYRMWVTDIRPLLPKPISVEEEMYLYLGEGERGNYFLRGTPDVVFETYLADWKTAGRGWKKDKAELSIQASLYMALAKQNLDISVRKFTFYIYNKQKREWDSIATTRRVADINAALHTAEAYGRKLEAGVYTATPVPEASFNKKRGWYCSPKFCGAWNICPAKYLNDNVNEKTLAIRSWNA